MSQSDRELLELAAKAAGKDGSYIENDEHYGTGIFITDEYDCGYCWNPLEWNGEVLELAVKLKMDILQYGDADHQPAHACANYSFNEPYGSDPVAATRRAIVRAAAEIGKTMP